MQHRLLFQETPGALLGKIRDRSRNQSDRLLARSRLLRILA